MSSSILPGIAKGLDSALKVRDSLGIAIAEVYLVERQWSGQNVGDGNPSESKKQILPSPSIVDLSLDIRLVEGGSVRRGDLILKMIPKSQYGRADLLHETDKTNVEGLYLVNGIYYKAIHLGEKLLTWSVHIRPQQGGG